MKRLFSFLVLLLVLAGLLLPGLYFYYAQSLPDLGSKDAVFKAVKSAIEAQRQVTGPTGQKEEARQFELLATTRLPKHLLNAVVAMDACPDYPGAPKEQGWPQVRRIARRWLANEVVGHGPQACQLRYADQVVLALGIVDPMRSTIADKWVLDALTADELLAYRISTVYYGDNVIGPQAAARKLFKLELAQLDLGQTAELLAAEGYFTLFQRCQNPAKLRMYRDAVLDRMEAFRLLGQAESKAARARQVSCFYKPL